MHTYLLQLIFYWMYSTYVQSHHLKRAEESSNNSSNILSNIKILCTGFSAPEAKLFILFWYYILVGVVLLTHFTILIHNVESTAENLQNYINCSATARPNCEVYRERIEDINGPTYYLDLTVTMLLDSINLSNLMYVLQTYDIKRFILKLFKSQN